MESHDFALTYYNSRPCQIHNSQILFAPKVQASNDHLSAPLINVQNSLRIDRGIASDEDGEEDLQLSILYFVMQFLFSETTVFITFVLQLCQIKLYLFSVLTFLQLVQQTSASRIEITVNKQLSKHNEPQISHVRISRASHQGTA